MKESNVKESNVIFHNGSNGAKDWYRAEIQEVKAENDCQPGFDPGIPVIVFRTW